MKGPGSNGCLDARLAGLTAPLRPMRLSQLSLPHPPNSNAGPVRVALATGYSLSYGFMRKFMRRFMWILRQFMREVYAES